MRISTQRVFGTLLATILALITLAVPSVATAQATGGGSSANEKAIADAKPHIVRGTVLDENGKPMAGVGVIIATTLQGVVTDINGNYEIKATPVQELQFSFLGYKTATASISRWSTRRRL